MLRTYRTLYRIGLRPWENASLPAAVRALIEAPPPGGRAADLGCGTGRHARALAAAGWRVTAVDFVPAAVAAARRADPGGAVDWRVADVTDPASVDPTGGLRGALALLLDDGCAHGLAPAQRAGWAATVTALAAPGADLLVRAAPPGRRPIGPRGLSATDLSAALGGRWRVQPPPAPSWHRYTRSG